MSPRESVHPEFDGHEDLIAELRAGTLDAPDHLHRRVLEGRQSRRQRLAAMSRRRQALWLIPVAATLAVGAALVHGAFPGSPSTQASGSSAKRLVGLTGVQRSTHGSGVVAHREAARPDAPAGPNGAAGAAGATGANGATGAVGSNGATLDDSSIQTAALPSRTNQEKVTSADVFSSDRAGAAQIPAHRHVHAAASLQVVVPNTDALASATRQATAIVTRLGGYAQTVHQSTQTRNGSAFLDLRVPVGKANIAIAQLGALGRVVSQQVSTEDLQQKYSKQVDTLGRLRRSITVYKQALQSGSLTGLQRVEVQDRLTQAEYYLAAAQKAHRNTVASAATTDIRLTLATNQHAFVAAPGKSGRFGRLLHNAASFLALEGIIVLYVLIVVGPILLIAGLVWWLMRERRRRDERALLASA